MSGKTQNEGFTLMELIVTIAVIAIIVSLGIPSFQNLIDRNRLTAATEALFIDLNYARSESIKQNRMVAVYFRSTPTSWCYGIDDNINANVCNCMTAPDHCTVNGLLKIASNSDYPGIVLNQIDFTNNTLGFDPTRGLPVEDNALNTPIMVNRYISFQSALGKNGQIELNVLGRVTTLYP